MAQRNGDRIVREVPGVDGLLGTRRWMEIVPFVRQICEAGTDSRVFGRYALLGDPEQPLVDADAAAAGRQRQRLPKDQRRLQRALRLSAPSRRSRASCAAGPRPAIVAEARALCRPGRPQEIILIAQDTTDYGRDLRPAGLRCPG